LTETETDLEPSRAKATKLKEKLFYPESEVDTDLVLAPIPTGVEIFYVLRSSKSSETQVLELDLPDGARLRLTDGGGAKIVDDGERVMSIAPPKAHDATGKEIPASYDVDGDRLTVEVSHRSEDILYPALVDPVIEEQKDWEINPAVGYQGWAFSPNSPGFDGYTRHRDYGRGLTMEAPPGTLEHKAGVHFYYEAPGNAFVYRGEFWYSDHEPYNSFVTRALALPDSDNSVDAVAENGGRAREDVYGTELRNIGICARSGCPVDGTQGNRMQFQLRMTDGPRYRERRTLAHMGGARVFLHDNYNPAIAGLTHDPPLGPGGWTNRLDHKVAVRGTDGGLGVKRFFFLPPPGVRQDREDVNCTAQCPREKTEEFIYALTEGAHAIKAQVQDNVERNSPIAEWRVGVDLGKPEIKAAAVQPPKAWHGPGGATLHVEATDEDPSGPRAGVQKIETRLNDAVDPATGEPRYFHTQAAPAGCVDSCPLTHDFRFEDSDLPEGTNKVTVRVTDNAGNITERSLEVKADREAPTVDPVLGPMVTNDGRWIPDGGPTNTALTAGASDEHSSGPRAGVRSMRTRINGAIDPATGQPAYKHETPNPACTGDSCRMAPQPFAFLDTDFREGINAVRVEALDRAEPPNVGGRDLTVKVDRTPPTLNVSGSLAEAEGTEVTEASYTLEAAATDGEAANPRSGVRDIAFLVDGERKDEATPQDCPADSCPLSRSFEFRTADYRFGPHEVTVKATDQVGRESTKTFTVVVAPRTGDLPRYEFERFELTDELEMSVNVANGNALLRQRGFQTEFTETTDLEYLFDHAYNSLRATDAVTSLARGGWKLGLGRDVGLFTYPNGSLRYDGPTGERLTFLRRPDGTYRSPAGLDEVLVRNPDGSYAMTSLDTDEVKRFSPDGLLLDQKDPNGLGVDYEYNGDDQLERITDSDGRETELFYDDDGLLERIVDPSDAEHLYEHEDGPIGTGNLTAYVAPGSKRTEFSYDLLSGRLMRIRDHEGHETVIGYDDEGRIESLTRDGQETTYDYPESGKTVSTAPDGREVVYEHDDSDVVTSAKGGDSPPQLALGGDLPDEDGRTLEQEADYDLQVSGALEPIKSIELTNDRLHELPVEPDCEEEEECPGDDNLDGEYDFASDDMPVGENVIRVTARDDDGDMHLRTLRITVPPPTPAEPFEEPPLDPALEQPWSPPPVAPAAGGHSPSLRLEPALASTGDRTGLTLVQDSPPDPLILGISDSQEAIATFSPFFRPLEVRRVRAILPWNVVEVPRFRDQFAGYYAAVQQHNAELTSNEQLPIEIMVSFEKGCTPLSTGGTNCDQGNAKWLPSYGDYIGMTRLFRQAYPDIKTFSAWNEPNDRAQPFKQRVGGRGPEAAAAFTFGFHRQNCSDCQLVAADIIQNPKEWKTYLPRYIKALRRRYDRDRTGLAYPRTWGFHPYRDLNVLQYRSRDPRRDRPQSGTRLFGKTVGRDKNVWFSEVGSQIDIGPNRGRKPLSRQAADVAYLVDRLARTGGRIRRLYYHSLCENRLLPPREFDANLVGGTNPSLSGCGTARPAYGSYQRRSANPNRAR